MSLAQPPLARRVVVVVLDGLRADLVGHPRFPALAALRTDSAHTVSATTVLPSVTAAAMTSLMTGVTPAQHGMDSDQFRLVEKTRKCVNVPGVLRAHGLPSTGVVREVPWLVRPLARRIVAALGLEQARFAPSNAAALLDAARPFLRTQSDGMILIHWPDCDAIGHRTGWMSPAYLAAVDRMDEALTQLRDELARDDDTLLIALADHGGGGRSATHHDSAHPLDCTIPIMLHGPRVASGPLEGAYTLLDVPATILWALGVPVPSVFSGAPITEAFLDAPAALAGLAA